MQGADVAELKYDFLIEELVLCLAVDLTAGRAWWTGFPVSPARPVPVGRW